MDTDAEGCAYVLVLDDYSLEFGTSPPIATSPNAPQDESAGSVDLWLGQFCGFWPEFSLSQVSAAGPACQESPDYVLPGTNACFGVFALLQGGSRVPGIYVVGSASGLTGGYGVPPTWFEDGGSAYTSFYYPVPTDTEPGTEICHSARLLLNGHELAAAADVCVTVVDQIPADATLDVARTGQEPGCSDGNLQNGSVLCLEVSVTNPGPTPSGPLRLVQELDAALGPADSVPEPLSRAPDVYAIDPIGGGESRTVSIRLPVRYAAGEPVRLCGTSRLETPSGIEIAASENCWGYSDRPPRVRVDASIETLAPGCASSATVPLHHEVCFALDVQNLSSGSVHDVEVWDDWHRDLSAPRVDPAPGLECEPGLPIRCRIAEIPGQSNFWIRVRGRITGATWDGLQACNRARVVSHPTPTVGSRACATLASPGPAAIGVDWLGERYMPAAAYGTAELRFRGDVQVSHEGGGAAVDTRIRVRPHASAGRMRARLAVPTPWCQEEVRCPGDLFAPSTSVTGPQLEIDDTAGGPDRPTPDAPDVPDAGAVTETCGHRRTAQGHPGSRLRSLTQPRSRRRTSVRTISCTASGLARPSMRTT